MDEKNENTCVATLGNWQMLPVDVLRYKPSITMNKGFFSALAYIHQVLPYLKQNYFDKGIMLNLLYYSHNYGSYPNFQVIGDLIHLTYTPQINSQVKQFSELTCLARLCKDICGTQLYNEPASQYSSFKNNFKLAHKYFFDYFEFDKSITTEVNIFKEQFKNKTVLGLHYRGTDKNKVNWVTHISKDEFIQLIDYHLSKHSYTTIFISTDETAFILKMQELYSGSYEILYYDDLKNEQNSNSIHIDRLSLIETKIAELKCKKTNAPPKVIDELECNLKTETELNQILLKNVIVNSFLLSKCNLVLKTHSQVSAYAKIFNPELNIYRVNACKEGYWPDSHIPLYDIKTIDNLIVQKMMESKLKNEFSEKLKQSYKNH
jgi:hypothetical protein